MITVTAAAGTTGSHIVRSLAAAGREVRAFVHSATSEEGAREAGAADVVVGDMLVPGDVRRALTGAAAVVHIGPPMHPREVAMGETVIDLAAELGIGHVLLMSVTHPQLEPLLNHQSKLAVERRLLMSRLPYTLLQPMHYMQDVDVAGSIERGSYRQPYSPDRPLSFVDLADVAEVAALVLAEADRHVWATYELCGSDTLTGRQVAEVLGEVGGRRVTADRVPTEAVLSSLEGAADYRIDGMLRLFRHYDRYGITGSPNVLGWLLGRRPTRFTDYARREWDAAGRRH